MVRRYTFVEAEIETEFIRGTKMPGSLYDDEGRRISVLGSASVDVIVRALNRAVWERWLFGTWRGRAVFFLASCVWATGIALILRW